MLAIFVLIGAGIFLLIAIIREITNVVELKKIFASASVFVFGATGKGKDLLFQKVINARKRPYYANMTYGDKYLTLVKKGNEKERMLLMADLTLGGNTYENLMNGNVIKVAPYLYENTDFYVSDSGSFLPAHMDGALWKKFPSLPLFYAMVRQCQDAHIHVNAQFTGQLWKQLREQAGIFIKCRKVMILPLVIISWYTIYDRRISAEQDKRAPKKKMLNKYSSAETEVLKSENGLIKNGFFVQLKKNIKYDTRYFKNVFYLSEEKENKETKK